MSTIDSGDRPRIVVGIDGSDESKQALRWARSLAPALGAQIEAIAVWHLPAGYGTVVVPEGWDPEQDMREVLVGTVREVVGAQLPEGLHLIVREGNAAKQLLDASTGAAMVVVGSRGHGGFTGLLLGSVSSSIAHHAGCPVLVVHGDVQPPA